MRRNARDIEEEPEWERIGFVVVDRGLLVVADPSFLVGDGKFVPDDWGEMVDIITRLSGKYHNRVTRFPFPKGHQGMAIAVDSGYGDGRYPVYIRRNPDGRIMALHVSFDAKYSIVWPGEG